MKFICKQLPFAVAGALCLMAGQASALPVSTHSATATFSLGGISQPVVSQSAPTTTPVDIIPFESDLSGNSMFFHTYGSISPGYSYFGSRSSGEGVYNGSSPYLLQQYFAVPGGGPQAYVFNFTVENGELSAWCSDCSGGGSSSYEINIWLDRDINDTIARERIAFGNGSLVVNSDGSTLLTHDGLSGGLNLITNASGFTNSGGSIADGTTTAAGSNINVGYSWDSKSFSIPLGSFLPSTEFLLEYELITRATGNFAPGTACVSYGGEYGGEGGGGIEYGGEVQATFFNEGNFYCSPLGNTIARAGDPPSLTNVGGTGITAVSVPEPGSLALLGVGLAGAFAAGRRRKDRRKA